MKRIVVSNDVAIDSDYGKEDKLWWVSFEVLNNGEPFTWFSPSTARKIALALLKAAENPKSGKD